MIMKENTIVSMLIVNVNMVGDDNNKSLDNTSEDGSEFINSRYIIEELDKEKVVIEGKVANNIWAIDNEVVFIKCLKL